MTGPRRIIISVLLFLLLGSLLNIATAWLVSQPDPFAYRGQPNVTAALPDLKWPRQVPDHWPRTPGGDQVHSRCFGNHLIATAGETLRKWESDEKSDISWSYEGNLVVVLLQARCGWPAPAFERELYTERVFAIGLHTRSIHTLPDSPWRGGITMRGHRYPIRPLWSDFAINTLFYSAAAGALFLIFTTCARIIRRACRNAADRCPTCAYPRDGLPPSARCPECGGAPAPYQ